MKNNESSLFVFIASIIIGILISLNINFNRTYNRVFLNTKQYQEAYNDRNKFRTEIGNLRDLYNELNRKLLKYEYSNNNRSSVIEEVQNEIDTNKIITGQIDVEGEGIKITLNDASSDLFYEDADLNVLDKIIHNYDIYYVLNDLKNSGAEAISINGQRITDRTEVICDGALLRVNGVKIAAPFYIFAIGDKDVLKNYMLADENRLNILENRQIDVDVKEMDSIKIQAYTGSIDKTFITSAENK